MSARRCWNRILTAASAGVACLAWQGAAHAYDFETHQLIVDTAWEVMLASQDPALTQKAQVRDPSRAGRPAPTLRERSTNQAEWDAFLEEIKTAILKINRMPSGLQGSSKAGCADIAPNVTMGRITTRIDHGYFGRSIAFEGDFDDSESCSPPPWGREGLYGFIGQNGELGGDFGPTAAQGLILGWHSKAGDDCKRDVILNVNVAQVLINIPLPWLGGLSIRDFFGLPIFIIAAPIVCLVGLFDDDDQDCLAAARRASESANPATAAASLFPPIFKDTMRRDIATMTHFINADGDPYGADNAYNDRRGLWQERGGSLVDDVVTALFTHTGAVVDYQDANMIDRYDLGHGVGDGHPDNDPPRGRLAWTRETVGHVQMTPVDNFAFFGWNRFANDDQLNAKYLRWPLHAIGDASVPMHVEPSSGRGHQPYEHAFLRSKVRDAMRNKGNAAAQLDQARKILSIAFDVRQRAKAHSSNPRAFPIRDVITELSRFTLRVARGPGLPPPLDFDADDWAFCDTCSWAWHTGHQGSSTDHYTTNEMIPRMQFLFDESIAYTVALLVSAGQVPLNDPQCVEPGQSCSVEPCCVGDCRNDVCVVDRPTGPGTCDANNPCPHDDPQNPTLCVNNYCTGGHDCLDNGDCFSGDCQNGFCECLADGSTCIANQACCGGQCSGGICRVCVASGASCTANGECCTGACEAGACAPPGGPGTVCQSTPQCVRGNCAGGLCDPSCSNDGDCPATQSCNNGECGVPQGGNCNLDSDCVSGICVGGSCSDVR